MTPEEQREMENLKARVSNLELALMGMWALSCEGYPPHMRKGIDNMMEQMFVNSAEMQGHTPSSIFLRGAPPFGQNPQT